MQNLEKNGYLSNIRAQIRSSVFKTIDSQESGNNKVSNILYLAFTIFLRKCKSSKTCVGS